MNNKNKNGLYCKAIGNFVLLLQSSTWFVPTQIKKWCSRIVAERYRSQTHECGNWDWGREIPVLGIHKSKFLCSVKKKNHQQASVTLPNRSLFEAGAINLGMKGESPFIFERRNESNDLSSNRRSQNSHYYLQAVALLGPMIFIIWESLQLLAGLYLCVIFRSQLFPKILERVCAENQTRLA